MACRDYEYGYEKWLDRIRDRLANMTDMLSQLCRVATNQALELPPPVAKWWKERKHGEEVFLNREVFDNLAQMLCMTCRFAEERTMPIPPGVAGWWAEHKARDEQMEDLAKGLQETPIYATFWEEHAAKEPDIRRLSGINHLDAVRALEKVGFRAPDTGKHVVMTDGTHKIIIPRQDPVNAFAMARIISLAGLKEEEFLKLLGYECQPTN